MGAVKKRKISFLCWESNSYSTLKPRRTVAILTELFRFRTKCSIDRTLRNRSETDLEAFGLEQNDRDGDEIVNGHLHSRTSICLVLGTDTK
jgi:hypothetical protein